MVGDLASLFHRRGPTVSEPTATLAKRTLILILVALMLGNFVAALDETVVSTALPTIVADLHGASHVAWVFTGYILALTASMPLWGKLGDLHGRKAFFQAAIVLFLAGSTLSGISHSMIELIGSRAIQGLGAGGLFVGSQTIVGDVVSPRERGRYQGFMSSAFAFASVIGPLLGGIFVDDLSWRWIFYVNLPIGAIALVAVAVAVPGSYTSAEHSIDYAGAVLLGLAATSLVLLTSLGGTSFRWASVPIVSLGLASVVLVVAWVVVERRAKEAVMPPHLFANRTFVVTSAVGFVVGFAMFGAIVFLPLFLQDVRGVSPTSSGLSMLPLMLGLLGASTATGQIVSRTGRYRIFPIVGSGLTTLGLLMLSMLHPATSDALMYLYMLVLGIGIGGVVGVTVIAVQNAVPHEEIGIVTSGTTFFRTIGGSFGAAVFGAIFANVFVGNLAGDLAGVRRPPGLQPQRLTPKLIAVLPPDVHRAFVAAYGQSLDTVFLLAVPFAAVGFLLSLLLPEKELRQSVPRA